MIPFLEGGTVKARLSLVGVLWSEMTGRAPGTRSSTVQTPVLCEQDGVYVTGMYDEHVTTSAVALMKPKRSTQAFRDLSSVPFPLPTPSLLAPVPGTPLHPFLRSQLRRHVPSEAFPEILVSCSPREVALKDRCLAVVCLIDSRSGRAEHSCSSRARKRSRTPAGLSLDRASRRLV